MSRELSLSLFPVEQVPFRFYLSQSFLLPIFPFHTGGGRAPLRTQDCFSTRSQPLSFSLSSPSSSLNRNEREREKEYRKGPTFRPDSSLWAGEIPLGSLNENEEWPSSLLRGRTRQQLQERYPPPRFCTTHNWAMGEAVRERPTIEVTLEGRTDGLRLHVWKSRFDLARIRDGKCGVRHQSQL